MPDKALTVKAYRGDAKTLMAFNLDQSKIKSLAGFTAQCQPQGKPAYYIQNSLQFQTPGQHAQDPKEPANSSINAPFHKFRWLHVPGLVHQGLEPPMGKYTYTVTPRYFDDNQSLLPLDQDLSISVDANVLPFQKSQLQLAFTRGFTQSQAFVHHFGLKAPISPKGDKVRFDTSQQAGQNAAGERFTFLDEYEWLGYTARERLFGLINEVISNRSLHLDMFAYDLSEPNFIALLLQLAGQGRIRLILDNAALHHSTTKPTAEDEFEQLFNQVAKGNSAILRGRFGRYAHDKVLIVSDSQGAKKILTGSTNFSITGLYVNSNHVLIFDDPAVAQKYQDVFNLAWESKVNKTSFAHSPLAAEPFSFSGQATPRTDISFAPHTPEVATNILQALADRIEQEGQQNRGKGSVLFAVMEMDQGQSPVFKVLNELHSQQSFFSYGISDGPEGVSLYKPGSPSGVLVTGKPQHTQLPPPFNQVPNIGGVGHQIHHKFVVCGFTTATHTRRSSFKVFPTEQRPCQTCERSG